MPRASVRRPAALAALLALVLAVTGAVLPAAAPAIPVPAAFAPAVTRAADDDIDIATTARYVVDPAAHRIRVVVDITAVNRKPNAVRGPTITRYFFDGVNLGIQPEATRVRATQDGKAIQAKASKRDGYRLISVLFRDVIYFQETAKVRLAFDLPAGAPRSESDVRVGEAFVTFVAWAFGDRGSVRVELPANFRVDLSGDTMERRSGPAGTQAYGATTQDPLGWYAWVNATDDDALTRDRLTLADGEEVVIRGWPEDRPWRDRVHTLLEDGVPELVSRIGLDWPVDGALSVSEVHTPLLEGYAGFYDTQSDEITISEDLDDLTIVHEASHAWFNKSLFAERWITEGLADEYASRVLQALGRKRPAPDPVKRDAEAAFALEAWPPPAPIRDTESDAREQYGYDASWSVMRKIVQAVGEPGMRRLFAAAAAKTTAYPGEGVPERSQLANDWRRFLDLAEELGGGDGVEELITRWALAPGDASQLGARAAARGSYAELVEAGGTWAAPLAVRTAMDAWRFGAAADQMEAATAVLDRRDEIAALAAAQDLVPPAATEDRYQDADSESELAVLAGDLGSSLEALEALATTADAVAAPRDWLTDLGLDGADPDASYEAAREAWQAGDPAAATAGAQETEAMLAAAPEAGRTRAITVGGAIAAGTLVLLLLAVLLVVRGRRGRPARRSSLGPASSSVMTLAASDAARVIGTGGPSVAAAPVAAAPGAAPPAQAAAQAPPGPPAPPWPYATLPPDGSPAEPPAAPSARDEGAP